MRRLKRRISRRQFISWARFNAMHPIDGGRSRERLLAQMVVLQARAGGDNQIQVEDLMPDQFTPRPEDDLNSIFSAFQSS